MKTLVLSNEEVAALWRLRERICQSTTYLHSKWEPNTSVRQQAYTHMVLAKLRSVA